jgi:hypothetical protein
MEERLRTAQLNDSLNSIRHTLRVKSRMIQFKNANVRGQRDNIRSRAIIDRIHDKARAFAVKYRDARIAKLSLSGHGDWEQVYRPLADSDIRSYTDPTRLRVGLGRFGTNEDEHKDGAMIVTPVVEPVETVEGIELGEDEVERKRSDGTGLSRRQLSWIWTTRPISVEDGADEGDMVLRSEWCKSRARAARAEEEVILLVEEMRRTLKFLEWRSGWWKERAEGRIVSEAALQEALRAFALEQAALQDQLATSFKSLWERPLSSPAEPDQVDDSFDDEVDLDGDCPDDSEDEDATMYPQLDTDSEELPDDE